MNVEIGAECRAIPRKGIHKYDFCCSASPAGMSLTKLFQGLFSFFYSVGQTWQANTKFNRISNLQRAGRWDESLFCGCFLLCCFSIFLKNLLRCFQEVNFIIYWTFLCVFPSWRRSQRKISEKCTTTTDFAALQNLAHMTSLTTSPRSLQMATGAALSYTATCVMFMMRADPLGGQVGGGWALEIKSFLGPVKWHWADRRVPFRAQKTRNFQGPTPPTCPNNDSARIKNHYVQGRINHRCIGSFMYKSSRLTLRGCKGYLREVSGPI